MDVESYYIDGTYSGSNRQHYRHHQSRAKLSYCNVLTLKACRDKMTAYEVMDHLGGIDHGGTSNRKRPNSRLGQF